MKHLPSLFICLALLGDWAASQEPQKATVVAKVENNQAVSENHGHCLKIALPLDNLRKDIVPHRRAMNLSTLQKNPAPEKRDNRKTGWRLEYATHDRSAHDSGFREVRLSKSDAVTCITGATGIPRNSGGLSVPESADSFLA